MKRTTANLFIRWCAPLLVALAAVIATAQTVKACPTCSEAAAANDPEHEHMVKGYFYSILFMMGMPYTVFTCFCVYMYWEVKKARARKATQNPSGIDPTNLLPSAAAQPFPAADASISQPAERQELVEV